MSAYPRVKLVKEVPESEVRPVLGPAGNKARSLVELRKPVVTPPKISNVNKAAAQEIDEKKSAQAAAVVEDLLLSSPSPTKKKFGSSIMKHQSQQLEKSFLLRSNLSMNASCSSDASTDSSHSRASTGRIRRGSLTPTRIIRRKPQCGSRIEKVEKLEKTGSEVESVAILGVGDDSVAKKRCAWVTPNTDPTYAAFHDEEWGVPVHEDKKLFELLSLSIALAELAWPTIVNKRHIFREVFLDFDPVAVSKLNEKKIAIPGNPASSLLSELKLRAIIENARQTCKIIEELGSFEKYIWGFVSYKPTISNFRYPRQVPIKTSKAEAISKDLVRRGFRGVGPTVVYSFMQVAGITNDHLVTCFRFRDCIAVTDANDRDETLIAKIPGNEPSQDSSELGALERTIDVLSLSTL